MFRIILTAVSSNNDYHFEFLYFQNNKNYKKIYIIEVDKSNSRHNLNVQRRNWNFNILYDSHKKFTFDPYRPPWDMISFFTLKYINWIHQKKYINWCKHSFPKRAHIIHQKKEHTYK